ncbi:lysM domain-containing GPI-anchored protein [Salix suchowensis]|nr:lysM domain-containing GPI-anchored protein [Salix suchowensis]
MGFARILVCLLFYSSFTTISVAQQAFRCTEKTSCHSLVGYKSPNTTSISSIQKLFGVKNRHSLLGANNLPLSTPSNYVIREQQVIKIPIPCICFNGTGASNKMPIYTVQPGDTLSYIASDVFMGLLTYPRIQQVNQIENPDKINASQELWIPLPCSCEEVEGERVVHYAHLVEAGSTVEEIAAMFGTTNDTLYRLNGIVNNSQLIAETAFDVPLKACNSSVREDSLDSPFLVPNNTYFLTASNCVKCKCDAANNWILQCDPSRIKPSNWSTCPAMQCEDSSLTVGSTTVSSCNTTTCAYAGYNSDQNIFTTLATQSTCPVTTAPGGSPGNFASRIGLSWNYLFISIHLICFLYIFFN